MIASPGVVNVCSMRDAPRLDEQDLAFMRAESRRPDELDGRLRNAHLADPCGCGGAVQDDWCVKCGRIKATHLLTRIASP
jgi:hypothetical protein